MFDPALSAQIDYARFKMEQSHGLTRRYWYLWLRWLERRIQP